MLKLAPDSRRIAHWRMLRQKIRLATTQERQRLLRGFCEEVRVLLTLAARASSGSTWNLGYCMELAGVLGVLSGGWLSVDPFNPGWLGRDRLLISGDDSLIAVCSALATVGFFSPEHVASLADEAVDSPDVVIPGLEQRIIESVLVPATAWDIAVASRRHKELWRKRAGGKENPDWAEPDWLRSPAMWRTCAVIASKTAAANRCWKLPGAASEEQAGLVVVVLCAADEAGDLASMWQNAGWTSGVIARSDRAGLYDALTAPLEAGDRPLALMAVHDGSDSPPHRTHGEKLELLGDLPDDQFHAIMDETFKNF